MGFGMTGPKGVEQEKGRADTLFHSSCVGAPFFALCLLKRPSFRPDLLSESEAMEGGIYSFEISKTLKLLSIFSE